MLDAYNGGDVRDQLLKFSWDLQHLAKTPGKPIDTVVTEARAKLDLITKDIERPDEAFNRITALELARAKFDMTYLVEGVLVKDQPAGLVGPKKALKTNISLDLAISLATGGKFLGYFNVPEPKRMAVMSGESGMATIQETAKRICTAAGRRLEDTGIMFSDTVPRFGDPWHMDAFQRFLRKDAIEVVIIDPAYLCLPADVNAASLFDVGRVLRNVSETCRDAGATLVLIHHLKKGVANPFTPAQLEDIGWAGFQEFFRQWILVNRREAYELGSGMHRLWLSAGGSAGHSCLVGLDIFEGVFDPKGTSPRVWDVSVIKTGDVVRAAAERRERANDERENTRVQAKLKRDMDRLVALLADRPDGETVTSLTNGARLSRDRGRLAIESLADLGRIVACKVKKHNRDIDGYKLATKQISA